MSLEGVLTGGALGLVLLYLFQESAQAGLRASSGGPVSLAGPVEFGPFQGGAGRIRIRPLSQEETEIPSRRPQDSGADGFLGGGGRGSQGLSLRRLSQQDETPFEEIPQGVLPVASPQPGPIPPGPRPPIPPGPTPPPPGPEPAPLPQLVLVVVQTESAATARSIYGRAASVINARQVGINQSRIDYTRDDHFAQEVISNRLVPGLASSMFNDADLDISLEHIALLDTAIRGGDFVDFVVFRADELIPLGLLAAGRTTASLNSRTATLDRSSIDLADGDDLLALEAVANLRFYGLGESDSTDLVFSLLSQGMRDSFVSMGPGLNSVTINSGFYRNDQAVPLSSIFDFGLDFQFDDAPVLRTGQDWAFSLQAKAVGMEDSRLQFGDSSDDLTIFTRIDENLAEQLGPRVFDPETKIDLQRIGLLNSSVIMGGGDDRVRINGAVVDSVIDLGDGNNLLLLEQALQGTSRIVMGDGSNRVLIESMLGGVVNGGGGDNTFRVDDLILAGELNGGGGFNRLIGPTSQPGTRDVVVINGIDQGFFNGLNFRAIQEVDAGSGGDVVIMNFNASLAGRLLGGDGLDRLEFLSWQTPVEVDLDQGIATAVFNEQAGGISGFEVATGGASNDRLAASGRFQGLFGGGGSDTFFLRWTPWESPAETGLQVGLNPQTDRLVLSGLEADRPVGWDGRWGLPEIQGLDLAQALGVSDQIFWNREQEGVLALTPSGPEGLGDVRLLPIAPLEQLLSGSAGNPVLQLAVNTSPLLLPGGGAAELLLLGTSGPNQYQTVAHLSNPVLGVHEPRQASA